MFFPLASINNNALIMVNYTLNDRQNGHLSKGNKIGTREQGPTLQKGIMQTAKWTRGSIAKGVRTMRPTLFVAPLSYLGLLIEQKDAWNRYTSIAISGKKQCEKK